MKKEKLSLDQVGQKMQVLDATVQNIVKGGADTPILDLVSIGKTLP